jgi:DNA segregation ATPase FtsK/SpoIIIE-like protein
MKDRDEALLREAKDALETLADRSCWPVQQAINRLKERLGDRANAVGADDPLYAEAVQIVMARNRCSLELLQRELRVGYARIAKIVDALEAAGLVTGLNEYGYREVNRPAPPKAVNE